jgi:hypothetical protein
MICFFSAASHASGVIVDVKGNVNIQLPDGKTNEAKIGVELPDGAKISTDKSSSISVMMMDGSIVDIEEKKDYTIGVNNKKTSSKTVIDGLALAMNEASASFSGPTVHGMVKMTQLGPNAPMPSYISATNILGPYGIYPVETIIDLSDEIVFSWRMDKQLQFTNPVVVVENSKGKKLAIKTVSQKDTSAAMKVSRLKLQPGENYSWYLASNDKRRLTGKTRRYNFGILSTPDKIKLEQDKHKIMAMNISDDGKKFLIAQLYYRVKMNDAMVKTLLPLWEKEHSDAIKKLLRLGYSRMGQAQEMVKYQ